MKLIDADILINKLNNWRRLSVGEEKKHAETALKIAREIPIIAIIHPPKKENDK